MPYGDVVRVGGGCGPLYLNGQEDFYFVRGVAVRRIKVSQKIKSAVCLSAHLSIFLVF